MKGKSISIIGIFAAVIGVIFILCYNTIRVSGITITCGVLFVGVGLVNLVFFGHKSSDKFGTGPVLDMVTNAAAIVLGISMLVFLQTFIPMIAFMFGMLVAVCALWQFFVLAVGARPYQLPAWLYLFPLLLAAGAIYLFMCDVKEGDQSLILASGISFAILGVACVIEGAVLGVARRNYEKAHAEASDTRYQPDADDNRSANAEVEAKPAKRKVETTEDLDDPIFE